MNNYATILKGGVGSGRKVTFHPVQEDRYKTAIHVDGEPKGMIHSSMRKGGGHTVRIEGVKAGGLNVRTMSDAKNVARAAANKDTTLIPAGVPHYGFSDKHFG